MANTVTKHETVLGRTDPLYPEASTLEIFTDGDRSVTIPASTWRDLDEPDRITVAIWPGDRLNDHPHTKAARTDAPVPDDIHADMPCHD